MPRAKTPKEKLEALPVDPPVNTERAEVEVGSGTQMSLVFKTLTGQILTVDTEKNVIRFTCECPQGISQYIISMPQFDAIAAVRSIQART